MLLPTAAQILLYVNYIWMCHCWIVPTAINSLVSSGVTEICLDCELILQRLALQEMGALQTGNRIILLDRWRPIPWQMIHYVSDEIYDSEYEKT